MKIEPRPKTVEYFIKAIVTLFFLITLLYIVYEPFRIHVGTEYSTTFSWGMVFGFVFVPVISWFSQIVLRPIITYLINKNIIKIS